MIGITLTGMPIVGVSIGLWELGVSDIPQMNP